MKICLIGHPVSIIPYRWASSEPFGRLWSNIIRLGLSNSSRSHQIIDSSVAAEDYYDNQLVKYLWRKCWRNLQLFWFDWTGAELNQSGVHFLSDGINKQVEAAPTSWIMRCRWAADYLRWSHVISINLYSFISSRENVINSSNSIKMETVTRPVCHSAMDRPPTQSSRDTKCYL